MITPPTINGSWYIVTLNQPKEDQPNAALVLDWGRGLFRDHNLQFLPEAKCSLEELMEIAALGRIETESYIYEKPVNYRERLSEKRLVRKDEETFEGVGNLGVYNSSGYTQERWITPSVAEELLQADSKRPYYAATTLFVVRYRDANDRNTNPFHQIGVIARDEEDIRQFKQRGFPNWFDEGERDIKDMAADIQLRFLSGMVVMPKVISCFQKRAKESTASLRSTQ